uniref:cation channel sperm-associated auxiliary subunit delta-like isoform X2 n=1 Tax=Pristiophorus japonicus TaxID=55135 RepID=UPI00398ED63F
MNLMHRNQVTSNVFLTTDGFHSSLYPLSFPHTELNNATLEAAVFVKQHVVTIIGEYIYIYNPSNKLWRLAEGITMKIDGISSYQCCINVEPYCETTSSLVVAYHNSTVMSEVSIFISNDGGMHFEQITLVMPSKGIFEGAFIQPTVSTLSLLIRVNRKASMYIQSRFLWIIVTLPKINSKLFSKLSPMKWMRLLC